MPFRPTRPTDESGDTAVPVEEARENHVIVNDASDLPAPSVNTLLSVDEDNTLDLRVRCTSGTSACTIRRMSFTVSE